MTLRHFYKKGVISFVFDKKSLWKVLGISRGLVGMYLHTKILLRQVTAIVYQSFTGFLPLFSVFYYIFTGDEYRRLNAGRSEPPATGRDESCEIRLIYMRPKPLSADPPAIPVPEGFDGDHMHPAIELSVIHMYAK